MGESCFMTVLASTTIWLCRISCLLAILLPVSATSGEVRDYLKKRDNWFTSNQAHVVAQNILSHQTKVGGWPKNTDTAGVRYEGDPARLKATYDNSATTDELRFLARIYAAANVKDYRSAFDLGLDHVLDGQYENGGWPQSYPPGKGYGRHITFNDNAMVRLLEFVREVSNDQKYLFVDDRRRGMAEAAFGKGIECILKCQIQIDGRLTGWCAQHDAIDFRPQSARSYELATLSGAESVGIVRLLMSINDPAPEVVRSVDAAVAWFEASKLVGIRLVEVPDQQGPKGVNKLVVRDTNASPMWARFYDLKTNQPIFCDRDGVPKRSLADIGYERRNGYAWYGNWPERLLDREYPAWKEQHPAR